MIIIVLLLLLGLLAGWQTYCYFTPHIEIRVMSYRPLPMLSISTDSWFGYPNRLNHQLEQWTQATDDVVPELLERFGAELDLTCNVQVKDSQTIVTYQGSGTTSEGETILIDYRFLYDFVLTEDIIYK